MTTETAPYVPASPAVLGTPALAQGIWTLDTAHTTIGFTIRHLGVSKVRGRFGDVSAELVVGPTLEECQVSASVALASIDTSNEMRDNHLRSAELFDVEKRTAMSYRSTRVHGSGTDWTLEGELTIGEVTRPLALAIEFGGVQSVYGGARHAGFEATGEIRRKDFGLEFGPVGAVLGDVVKIELDLEFIEPQAEQIAQRT